jgi:glycosyltransferase involved in cell wall biosynthesis
MLSICITVKNRSKVEVEGRQLLLLPNCIRAVKECIRPGDAAELVISDWRSDDWPLAEWAEDAAKPIPLTLVTVDGCFSRGRGLNLAFESARGDILLFLDADILVCREVIETGLVHVAEGRAFYPIYYQYTDPDHRNGRWLPESLGNVMVARDVFLRAGRWPELKSWGREDNLLHDAIKTLVPVARERFPGMRHQWHPESFAWKNRYADPQYRNVVGAR